MTNTQISLQPDLINHLSLKIDYLQSFEQAVAKQNLPLMYELLDAKRYHKAILKRKHGQSNAFLSELLTSSLPSIADCVRPFVIDRIHNKWPFLTIGDVSEDNQSITLLIGDWWQNRPFAKLNVVTLQFAIDQHVLEQLEQTEQLPAEGNLRDQEISELNQTTEQYRDFLDESVKRNVQIQIITDQLDELNKQKHKNKDIVANIEQLQTEKIKLEAAQKRIPNIKQTFLENQEQLVVLQKEATLIRLELGAILQMYGKTADFVKDLEGFYTDFMQQLLAGESDDRTI